MQKNKTLIYPQTDVKLSVALSWESEFCSRQDGYTNANSFCIVEIRILLGLIFNCEFAADSEGIRVVFWR